MTHQVFFLFVLALAMAIGATACRGGSPSTPPASPGAADAGSTSTTSGAIDDPGSAPSDRTTGGAPRQGPQIVPEVMPPNR